MRLFVLFMMLLLILPMAFARDLRVEQARFMDDVVMAGTDIVANVVLENDNLDDADNYKVSIFMPELGIRASTGIENFEIGDQVSRRVVANVPLNVMPGLYTVRIVASGDDGSRRVVHRFVYIN